MRAVREGLVVGRGKGLPNEFVEANLKREREAVLRTVI